MLRVMTCKLLTMWIITLFTVLIYQMVVHLLVPSQGHQQDRGQGQARLTRFLVASRAPCLVHCQDHYPYHLSAHIPPLVSLSVCLSLIVFFWFII